MENDEDFLAAVEADNANAPVEEVKPEAETPAAEAPTPEAETPVPAEPAPEAPVAEVKPEPIMVPLTALHETRDKVKALEDRLAALQPKPEPVEIPDRDEDPEGYEAYRDAQLNQTLLNVTLNTSERFARKEHGAEIVDAAKQWAVQKFGTDSLYQAQILRDPDPYERVVTDYKREQLFSKVTDPSDFDAFLAWKAANAQLTPNPAPPNPTPQIPPRSLASAPSAGGVTTDVLQTDQEIFEEVMPKR